MALRGSEHHGTIQIAGQHELLNGQAHILISGRDSDLLETRRLVLQTAGHRVSTTLEPIRGLDGLDSVQLLIVCHTLNERERLSDLAALVAACPEGKVLCIEPYPGEKSSVPTLNSYAGPREMVRVVSQLLSGGLH